jgi:peptidoglycan hydrolase-like protein with peptidoglycan-binding domain
MSRRSRPFRSVALALVVPAVAAGCSAATSPPRTAAIASPPAVLTIVSGLQEDLLRLGYHPGPVTGAFSPTTVAALERFQTDSGVAERGALGPATAGSLDARLPDASEAVRALQSALTDVGLFRGVIDGRYDDPLLRAVDTLQRDAGIPVDGEYGPQTDAALRQLYARVVPGSEVAAAAPGTTTSAAPTTSTTDNLLRVGRSSPEVAALQQRLVTFGYRPGPADGFFGAATESAVLAFEKREGLTRDGIAGPQVLSRIAAPTGAGPRGGLPVPRIEVDIARQLVFVVFADAVWTLNASTGSGLTYEDPTTHARDLAYTPVGSFVVQREVNADVQAPLGTLHRPLYFFEGWAVHGAASVPAFPASHGCVRISDADADWLFPLVPVGTAVVIYDTTGHSPGPGQAPPGATPGY